MRVIRISSKKNGIHKVLVDNDDFEMLSKFKWHIIKNYKRFYAATQIRVKSKKHQYKLFMHRLIMGVADKKVLVDHADMNGLNNQKTNLRLANGSQNSMNREFSDNSSGFRGVYADSNRGTFRARIGYNYELLHIGTFKDAVSAARAYNKAAKKYFGKYAQLNKIPS